MIEFKKSVSDSFKLKNVSNEDQLILYGLYKQGTIGDCNIERPMWFKRKMMWEAWKGYEGLDTSIAQKMYIDKVNELMQVE